MADQQTRRDRQSERGVRHVLTRIPAEYSELLDRTVAEDDTTVMRWARGVLVRELQKREEYRAQGIAKKPLFPVSHRRPRRPRAA